MQTEKNKKVFTEPSCDVMHFAVEDILTTSNDGWAGGDIEITAIEEL